MASHHDHQTPKSEETSDSRRLGFAIAVAMCDKCNSKICATNKRYRCEQCPDYDSCQECYFSAPTCSNDSTHSFKCTRSVDDMDEESFKRFYLDRFYAQFPLDSSLNQVRILHVHRANDYDDPIEACLQVKSLDTKMLCYSALSYCWGTGLATRLIKINSVPVPITEHLESALKRVRSVSGQIRIWVDAICINQFDNDEKSIQVGMMRKIYSKAMDVYIYLGEQTAETLSKPPFSRHEEQRIIEELNSKKFSSELHEYKTVINDIVDRPWFSRTWVIQESSVNLHAKILCGSLNLDIERLMEWIGVLRFDQKAFSPKATSYVGLVADHAHPAMFTLHLIQKLRMIWLTRDMSTALSRLDTIIGHVDWQSEDARRIIAQSPSGRNEVLNLEKLIEESASNVSAQPSALSRLKNILGHWQNEDTRRMIIQSPYGRNEVLDLKKLIDESVSNVSVQPFKLISLLEDFRRLSATDPRDKVYATIGLATDASDRPQLDYGLPPAKVFESFAADLIRKGDGVSVLHAAVSHSQGMDLPSWVPDWTSQKCTYVPLNSLLDPSIRAGGDMTPNLDPLNDKSVIKLSGCIADRIWFVDGELTLELAEKRSTDQKQIVSELLHDHVSAFDNDGREWSVREGIRDNRLDQMCERNRASRYPKWLSWLSIIISLKMFAHLQPKVMQDVAKRREGWQATLPIAHDAKALSDGNDSAPPSTSHTEPAARSFGDLEALMIQAVDPAAFPPAPDPDFQKDENYYLLENRCLCITRSGRLGLVPKTAQEDDEILIFSGAVTPFVVRGSGITNEDGAEERRLVGDCYIRGLMHGEGLREDIMGQIEII